MRTWRFLGVAAALGLLVASASCVTVERRDDDPAGMHLSRGRAVAEERFLGEMVAHHEEAVAAARELERSQRAPMRRLGQSIVEAQAAEIEPMVAWLDEWYGGPPEISYQPMMRDLTGLTGNRLDRVFLEDMLVHHMHAVMMARRLLHRANDLHDEVTELAGSIIRTQRAEMVTMARWLDRWFEVRWAGRGGMRRHGMGTHGHGMHRW
jgi:uncharacterized protein (DUF305 family)